MGLNVTQAAERSPIYTPPGLEEALYTVEGMTPEIDGYDDLNYLLRGAYDIPHALATCVRGYASRKGIDNSGNILLGYDRGWQVTAALTDRVDDMGFQQELLVVALFKRSLTRLRYMGQSAVLIVGVSGEGNLGTSDVVLLQRRKQSERYAPWESSPEFAERFHNFLGETVDFRPDGKPMTGYNLVWQKWQERHRAFMGFLTVLFDAGSAVVNLTEY